jgi:hypothetical protein
MTSRAAIRNGIRHTARREQESISTSAWWKIIEENHHATRATTGLAHRHGRLAGGTSQLHVSEVRLEVI